MCNKQTSIDDTTCIKILELHKPWEATLSKLVSKTNDSENLACTKEYT